ncbi:MAG: hypothetical protein Q4C13_00955 [Clostridia bacterium]|nr:hypothetical protein [Clostridia bacterium]
MCRRKKRADFEDDGRVIAPMNVEGMPWYVRRAEGRSGEEGGGEPAELTRGEKLAFTWGVVKAGLLVVGVFVLVYLGFILFCTEIWFR